MSKQPPPQLHLELPNEKQTKKQGTPIPTGADDEIYMPEPVPRRGLTQGDTPRDPDKIGAQNEPPPREKKRDESSKYITPPLGLMFQHLYAKNSKFLGNLPADVKERIRKKQDEFMEKRYKKHDEKMQQRVAENYTHNNIGNSSLWEACYEFLDEQELEEIKKSRYMFKNFVKSQEYDKNVFFHFNQADKTDREEIIQSLLESIEMNSNNDSVYSLLYIVLGCYRENEAKDYKSKNMEQMEAMKKNCTLLYECNALPTLLQMFKRHAFAIIEGKEKDNTRLNLFANVLFIFLCTMSWEWEQQENRDLIQELQFDLFEHEKNHFIRMLMVLLKESLVTNTNLLMPSKKITLLLAKSLCIFLGKPTSETEGFVFGPDVKLKVRQQDAQQFNEKHFHSKRALEEAPKQMREAIALFESLSTPQLIEANKKPRFTIENPTNTEKLYRLLLPECMNLIASLLLAVNVEDEAAINEKENPARHREIVLKAAATIFFYLIKHFRKEHPKQASYVIRLLTDANAPVLFLNALNKNADKYVKQDADNPQICLMRGEEFTQLDETNSPIADNVEYSWRNTYTILTILRLLQKLTKDKDATVHKLAQHKAHIILKKVLKVNQRIVIMYTCKIFKSLWKYLAPKWQQSHIEVVNQVYAHVKPLLVDNWLQSQQSTPISQQQRNELNERTKEANREVEEFNKFNYEQWWKHLETDTNLVLVPEENFVPIEPIVLAYNRTQIDSKYTTSVHHYETMLSYLLASSGDAIW